MERKMKGIRIGVIVKKKCGNSQLESVNDKMQGDRGSEGIYINDPESHNKFVQNIFSVLKT